MKPRLAVVVVGILAACFVAGADTVTRPVRVFGIAGWDVVYAVAYSHDGARMAVSVRDRVYLVNSQTYAIEKTLDAQGAVAFSPDDTQMVSGGRGSEARLWDLETGSVVREFANPSCGVSYAEFSKDGTRILTAGDEDESVVVWDAGTGEQLYSLAPYVWHPQAQALSPDGRRVIIWSAGGCAYLWDEASGDKSTEIPHVEVLGVTCTAFSPDGSTVIAGGRDGDAILLDLSTEQVIHTLAGHTADVTAVGFSADGRMAVTGSKDKMVKLWDVATGSEVRTIAGHNASVTSVAFSPDGKQILSGSWDATARSWDAATGALMHSLSGHGHRVNTVAFSPLGTSVLTDSKLWEVSTGNHLRTFVEYDSYEHTLLSAFTPDGSRLVALMGGRVSLWDVATACPVRNLTEFGDTVSEFPLSGDGTKLLMVCDRTVTLLDIETGNILRKIEEEGMVPVSSVALNGDGTKALVRLSGVNAVRQVDLTTGQASDLIKTDCENGHTSFITSIACSPDGTHILTGSWDKTAKLWDVATAAPVRAFTGHDDWVECVAFSPDGKTVLTGSKDGTAKLWSVHDGTEIRTYAGHTSAVTHIAFSPDGGYVLTCGSEECAASLWRTAPGDSAGASG